MNKEVDPKEVGKRIKKLRLSIGKSMTEFGKMIDDYKENGKVRSGTVSNWETGKNLPNNERLKKIAELCEVSVDYLLYGVRDLQGNEMPLPELSTYSYKFISYKVIIPKDASSKFIYSLHSIKDANNTKGIIIRTTLITNDSNEIKEIYFEDFNEYDYHNFVPNTENDKKKFHDAIPINSNDEIIDFRWYVQHKKTVISNFIDSFFNKYFHEIILPYIDFKASQGSNIKISKEVKLYYINLFNHFNKIELNY